jgi:hypothetical protein
VNDDDDHIAGVQRNTQERMDFNNNLLDTIYPDTPNNLTSISASLMWKCNECDKEKEEASHNTLEGYKKGLDPDHSDTLKCGRMLASVLFDQENYAREQRKRTAGC